ncbi:MAG: helix-turn-helix domain-containing protein [Ilumatobacteraceae bacterium]
MGSRPHHVDSEGGALRRAKALSVPTRVEMLERLRVAESPLTAGALATMLGVHHTAIRQHLVVLLAAGLVRPQALPVAGRGRPRTGYVTTASDQDRAYRELAGMLAGAVRTGSTARAAGHAVGVRVEPSADGPLATLRDEAERLGFEPEVHERAGSHDLVLGACPFAELATTQPETVCQLHLGLAEGIAERAGGVVVDGIRLANPNTGGCRIVLRDAAT